MTNLLAAALPHGQFWAIHPSFATAHAMDLKATDYEAHVKEYEAVLATRAENPVKPEDRRYPVRNGVALVRIDGVMTKRPTSYGRGTSTVLARRAIEQADLDTDVRSILIVADSPGGSVDGIQDLHDAIAATTKPTRGHVDGGAFSAAYWTLCACDRITIGRTDSCGSLGVMAVLADTSEMAKEEGVEVLLFATGELKGQGTDGVPISPAARAMYQGHVDTLGEFFAAAIASGRKMTPKAVSAIFTGGIFGAQEALSLGLVDAIATLDEAFEDATTVDEDEGGPLAVSLPWGAAVTVSTHEETQPESIALSAEQKTALSAGVSRERFDAATPTISASQGGEDRPRAENTKPTASEKPHMDNWKNRLADAFRSRGKGVVASSLDNSTREDPESTARVVSDSIDAQVADHLANDPLTRSLKSHGIHSVEDLNAFAGMKEIGEAHAKATLNEAKAEFNRAFGAEGPARCAYLDHAPHAVVLTALASAKATTDSTYGISDKAAATRQTAPAGATAVDVEEPAAVKTGWDTLPESAKTQATALGITTPEAQASYAKNYMGVKN